MSDKSLERAGYRRGRRYGFYSGDLTLEFASGQSVLGNECQSGLSAHKRSDNSGSGMISENRGITC